MPDATPDQHKSGQHRRDAHDWATLFILILTLIAAGCAAGFTGWQAWIARDQEHRALRAYVVIQAELLVSKGDAMPFVRLTAENMGQTPVYNLAFNTWNSGVTEFEGLSEPELLTLDCKRKFAASSLDDSGFIFSKTTHVSGGFGNLPGSVKTLDDLFQKYGSVSV